MGNKSITIRNNDIFLEDEEKSYKGSEGLWELLTMSNPNPSRYNEQDLKNYAEIVLKTYTYKFGNKEKARRLKSSDGYKYTEIILPILYEYGIKKQPYLSKTSKKEGKRLQKQFLNIPKEFVYYNSIDQLLERLCILYGEYRAGNTNPALKNEIANIISEFKEL